MDVSTDKRSIIIEDSIFHFNNGTHGGALGFFMDNSSILLSDCNLTKNTGDNQAD